jgi:hypothetical protein
VCHNGQTISQAHASFLWVNQALRDVGKIYQLSYDLSADIEVQTAYKDGSQYIVVYQRGKLLSSSLAVW